MEPTSVKVGCKLLEQVWLGKGQIYSICREIGPEEQCTCIDRGICQLKSDYKLVIIGDAPYVDDYKEGLKRIAGKDVTFPDIFSVRVMLL